MTNRATVSIRGAEPSDVTTIVDLIRALAVYERLESECAADPTALSEHLFGPRAYAEVIIAEHEGKAAGMALFFHNYSTFLTRPGLYLEDLFVVPGMRGLGIGRALLARLASLAVERRCGRLEWSVLKWNGPAIGFYERLGAIAMNEWQVYRLTGDELMQLAGESA
jgi:GNAT superfamily N-acetyltransferase